MVYSYDLLWCLRSTYTPAPPSKNSQVQVPLYWSALQWSDNFPAKSSSRSHLWCLLKDTAWRWKPATSKSPREKKEKKQKQKIIASEHWLKNTVAIWIPIGRPVGNRTRPTLVKGKCHRHCATIDVTLLTRRTHEIHSCVSSAFRARGRVFCPLVPRSQKLSTACRHDCFQYKNHEVLPWLTISENFRMPFVTGHGTAAGENMNLTGR